MQKNSTQQETPSSARPQSSGPTTEQFISTLSRGLTQEQIREGGRRLREEIVLAKQERKNRQERLKARAEGRPDPL